MHIPSRNLQIPPAEHIGKLEKGKDGADQVTDPRCGRVPGGVESEVKAKPVPDAPEMDIKGFGIEAEAVRGKIGLRRLAQWNAASLPVFGFRQKDKRR